VGNVEWSRLSGHPSEHEATESGVSTELARLETQLERSFEGQAWHGPSVLEALKDVTPDEAYAHPVIGAHSIWELVLHLGGTYRLVLRRLQGEDAQLTPAEDWPSVPSPTLVAWQQAIRSLQDLNQQVRDAIHRFRPEQLDQPFTPGAPYTAYMQFIGITQHDLYHAGQIAILKKAWRERGGAAHQ
jgi:uncharacterized damage-inducible protein DinB